MSKLILSEVPNGVSNTVTNTNFKKIEHELNNNVLKRRTEVGEDNSLHTDLDMNSHRIYNLPEPVHDHEPARKRDISMVEGYAADAAESASQAKQSAIEAAGAAASVQIKEQEREQIFKESQEERENRFNDFIASSGYQFLGDYAAGIEITEYNQIIRDADGEFWRLSGQVELPYTTTGAGLPEDDSFTTVGDAALRQDLAGIGWASVLDQGVMSVDTIADLVALPASHRRADLRYLVKERVEGSGVGGGEFIWDGTSTEETNGGTVFSPDESLPGRFVRLFEGSLRSYWFLEGDKRDLAYVQKALEFAFISGLDINLDNHETFNTSTPFIIGPDSGKYSGTISGYLNINANDGFPPEATLLTIRNCNGEISANILANGFDRCRVAIEYRGTGRLTFSGDVHGRRATMWGHRMNSIFGNSNSMRWLGELRSTGSGSNYTQDFQYMSSDSRSSTIITPEILEIGIESLVRINEKWYHIESSNSEETVIQPPLPTEDRIDGSMQIFVGGGFVTRGSDAGVGVISKMVMQTNAGVGMRCGSLYGQVVNSFVGEMNAGPSIVVGSSTTGANLKNVFVDSYFEGGPKHRVVCVSGNSQIDMPTHFNLGRDGVYFLPVAVGQYSRVNIPHFSSAGNGSSYSNASSRELTKRVLLGDYYFYRSREEITDGFNIELFASSGEVSGGATIILYNFNKRPVNFTCSRGDKINGMPSLTLNSPGTIGITAVKTEDGWALSSFETTILEDSGIFS